MKRYEAETGKKAVWHGRVTEGFKKWQKGEKIYERDKERITILIPEETKTKWQEFIDKHNIPTISKLIREAVNFYVKSKSKLDFLNNFSKFSHDLKEPLTSIKGFSQIIIENYLDKVDLELSLKLREIYNQSLFLEIIIDDALRKVDLNHIPIDYDILIIEDDIPTIAVLEDFFERKGYKSKGVTRGNAGLEELNKLKPKLILLDILLPDISGYQICKKLKSDMNFKDIPIFYITAVPKSEVSKKMEETMADGFLLKPFNFSDFKILFNYL
ncbi:MAG: response regulator [Promethearchaeota archaeon]